MSTENKMKLYSYIVAHDFGLAPNPFWGELTLSICKPKIRLSALEGDWIIGTGSKNVDSKDGGVINYSGKLVYAMKITGTKTMEEYDAYCNDHLKPKIPFINKKDWRRIVGDSIYDFSIGKTPRLRKVLHKEEDKPIDLSGKNTLLSKHFYYFGSEARIIPPEFTDFIKKEQGHKVIADTEIIKRFEKWLKSEFELNKLYGNPQLRWKIDKSLSGECEVNCDN